MATFFVVVSLACSVAEDLSKRRGAGPLFKIYDAGKYGYMDREGNVFVPPQFDRARDFFHGLAAVSIGKRTGFVDQAGKFVIPARFDDARDFLEDLAPVRVGRRWGYIDQRGNMVIEPQFQGAGEFRGGLARIYVWTKMTIRRGMSKLEYTKGTAPEYVFQPPFEDPCGWPRGDDGAFGFIDKSGRVVIPPRFTYAGEFFDGLAAVCLSDCDDMQRRRYGYINQFGAIVIPPMFLWARDFSEGLAPISMGSGWGYVDTAGRVAIPPEYEFAGAFHEGLARVNMNRRSGYIDRQGKVVIPLQFRSTGDFSDGIAIACHRDCAYIDRTGARTLLWIVLGNGHAWKFSDGLAPVGENSLWTPSGLIVRAWNYLVDQPPGVVYIDKAGRVAGVYGR